LSQVDWHRPRVNLHTIWRNRLPASVAAISSQTGLHPNQRLRQQLLF
jgi:hypothetical protein